MIAIAIAAVLERVAEQLAEDEGERGRPLTRKLDVGERRGHLLAGDEPLDEHRPEPVDELVEIDDVLAMLGEHLVDGRDREDAVDRVAERLLWDRRPLRAPAAGAGTRRSAGCS